MTYDIGGLVGTVRQETSSSKGECNIHLVCQGVRAPNVATHEPVVTLNAYKYSALSSSSSVEAELDTTNNTPISSSAMYGKARGIYTNPTMSEIRTFFQESEQVSVNARVLMVRTDDFRESLFHCEAQNEVGTVCQK